MTTRREFIGTTLGAIGAAACAPSLLRTASAPKKKILILGGTGFVGPHQVRYALSRGHEVTIFNRGSSGKGMFGKDVEELIGDRRAGTLDALRGRKWDAVIDESASMFDAPEWTRASTTLLKDSVDQYLFISTRSVYFDTSLVPMTAAAPVLTRENSPLREGQNLPYGHAKAYAEKEAHAIMPGRVTVVRPGLIIGPGDDTDRFTYWPVRVARGGEVLVPGDGTDHVQIIDVRDLIEFNVHLVENKTFGVFNGVGPHMGRPFKEFIDLIHKGVNGSGTYTWVDAEFLRTNGAAPYGRELPVFQVMRGRTAGFARFDLTPELKAGIKFRSMEVTARETLEWFRTLPPERQAAIQTGFKPEREKQLLDLWKARK
ncbi:MAG TPA: NAD-dependent epimerase/dehydratase family protein [Gemmatimonadaceae bacterium]|nr:NAD-dependent epimerase/dehydratase family protein [Gemmatimonadaceae bacterium]